MVADKRPRIEADVDGESSQLKFEDLVYSIEKLQEVQDDIDKIDDEAFENVLEIEQKYNAIRKPMYVKRNEAIRSIPDFWSTAFLNHPMIGALLTDEDQKIFKHVDSLYVEEFEDIKMGYCITFNFNPNPYFENTKLTKTIKFFNDGSMTVTGTTIIWKEGKGHVDVSGDAGKGNKRPLSKESFFNWFGKPRPEETKVEQDWPALSHCASLRRAPLTTLIYVSNVIPHQNTGRGLD
ncbi:hypothetical protein ACJIZ3_014646 [Penstemon smallii]|uniref:Uncharacterized protein n=1 Tax=Penstemon smallii TaxID=265156 RepID=A0ABD3RKA8_9LAMI